MGLSPDTIARTRLWVIISCPVTGINDVVWPRENFSKGTAGSRCGAQGWVTIIDPGSVSRRRPYAAEKLLVYSDNEVTVESGGPRCVQMQTRQCLSR